MLVRPMFELTPADFDRPALMLQKKGRSFDSDTTVVWGLGLTGRGVFFWEFSFSILVSLYLLKKIKSDFKQEKKRDGGGEGGGIRGKKIL